MTHRRRVLLGRSEEISFILPLPSNTWQHKVQNNKWMAETWVPHRETERYFATWFFIPLLCCSCQETSAPSLTQLVQSLVLAGCRCWHGCLCPRAQELPCSRFMPLVSKCHTVVPRLYRWPQKGEPASRVLCSICSFRSVLLRH